MSGDQPAARDETRERLAKYRERLIELACIGVPVAVLQGIIQRVSATILSQPWQALVFLVPIGVVGWLILRGVITRGRLAIDWRFLAFIGAYVSFFSLAAQTKFLDWERDPTVFGEASGGSWLAPVSWGDWRYWLVPKVRGDDVVVVLREPTAGRDIESARAEIIDVIGMAAGNDADAIALDHYFVDPSQIDSALCAVMTGAGIPVLVGYGFERLQGRLQALPAPSSLRTCVTEQNSAHLVGLLDADHDARLIPLFFGNDTGLPALSLLAARTLANNAESPLPATGQLRFVEPREPHVLLRLSELRTNQSARNALKNRLVLVGEESKEDTFSTPFGPKPGAVVHADAVHSLLHSHYIRDVPWWVGLVLILASCYYLAASCAAGGTAAKMAIAAAVAAAFFAVVAVVGILTGPYWFDVSYPTVAVWLLIPLLLGLRRALQGGLDRLSRIVESG